MSSSEIRFGEIFAVPQKNWLTRPKKVRGAGVPMVNMGELFAHPRIHNLKMDRVPLADSESAFLLSPGDLLFARQSLVLAGAGQCSLFLGSIEPTTFESHLIRCRLDVKRANPSFYFNYFRSSAGRRVIEAIVEQGAGASGIRSSDLINVLVPFPPLHVQNEVAGILNSLDDRITLLRETNATLEATAQALFKSWFVDFDPVKAKQEGRAPEGMDEETAALFPDGFDESTLGMIPRGWAHASVDSSFILTMGQSPPGDTYNDLGEGTPFYQGRTDFGFRFPSRRIYCVAPTRFAEPGDTLLSVRAPVGDVNMAIEKSCLGRGVASIRDREGFGSFAFYTVRGLRSRFDLFDGEGTVFGSINKKDLGDLPVLRPPKQVIEAFERIARPIDLSINNNEGSIRSLSELRDTLLPRLISGQLRLPEREAN